MPIPRDPDARRYFRAAEQRLDEAKLLLEKVELPAASVYLAGYAVECVLKALLIERTPDGMRAPLVAGLKKDFGHNLAKLRDGNGGRGVELPPDVAKELTFVSSWSPELRYEPGPGHVRTATRFLEAACLVFDWADRSI